MAYERGLHMKDLKNLFFILILLSSACTTLEEAMEENPAGRKSISKQIDMYSGAQESMNFMVNKPGAITAVFGRKAKESKMATVTLLDPSGNVMMKNRGSLPLRLHYEVPSQMAENPGVWKIVVANEGDQAVGGKLRIYYPYDENSVVAQKSSEEFSSPEESSSEEVSENGEGSLAQEGGREPYYNEEYENQMATLPNGNSSDSKRVPAENTHAPFTYKTHSKPVFISSPRNEAASYVYVTAPGKISASAYWTGDEEFSLILNGPGQVNYYERKDGKSPLALEFYVTPELAKQGDHWTVSLKYFPKAEASKSGWRIRTISAHQKIKAMLKITYPTRDSVK